MNGRQAPPAGEAAEYGLVQDAGGLLSARPLDLDSAATPLARWHTRSQGLALVSEARDALMGLGSVGTFHVYERRAGGGLGVAGSVTLQKVGV